MVFSSNIFIFLYLPIFLVFYYGVKFKYKSYIIVVASYLFYAWWRPDFTFLFIGITVWNYIFGQLIYKHIDSNKEKAFRLLVVGVVGNLLTLAYFKYANFGAEVIGDFLGEFGFNTYYFEKVILPLGISFYVFQALSYIVDIYRKSGKPTERFVDFAAFISLFPQLIAGPILRYKDISGQLHSRTHSWELFSAGVCRFMLGFIKKVMIADSLAHISIYTLNNAQSGFFDTWIGMAASLIQLYFDFSGYSDMAIGLGMMMGFKFTENFNQPFTAMSLTEFWNRWHLTLSAFLRDYVFFPLVRGKKVAAEVGLLLTMGLSGFWHGASFSFIFFGLYFGVFMVLERKLNIATKNRDKYSAIKNIRTLMLLIGVMPFFMGGNLTGSFYLYGGMLGLRGWGSVDKLIINVGTISILFMFASVVWCVLSGYIEKKYTATIKDKPSYFMKNVGVYESCFIWFFFLISLSKLSASSFSPFLYFQF
ncbi:MAG: MBOAT family protein [Porticoccus sp.]|nr:MBOAT family protein [Porticoccus sp.]MBQ0808542.1 MBOAT family protein [Porticoccus sp.]